MHVLSTLALLALALPHIPIVTSLAPSILSLDGAKLYDIPVSNHGARIRMINNAKKLNLQVLSPIKELGGLKSPEYLALNPQGKMPLLTLSCSNGVSLSIPESDTISRFILSQTLSTPPTFLPPTPTGSLLSDHIVRLHDQYITPIQGSMYRALGSGFGPFSDDRQSAIDEIIKQLNVISSTVENFYEIEKELEDGVYIVGKDISLADATIFPTLCFTEYMLPKFFGYDNYNPFLQGYFSNMCEDDNGKVIKEEIYGALEKWEEGGRWESILEEGVGNKEKVTA
ncbi:hypothetical protein TrST_g5624 [Triparma strigata]|uniref:GST N-terminal domain-containing protein n=1 Tax=Triparma strigata TaxID=1606541 RepID=A0A9W6ZDV0_9STRA|nr:hypothetical protein TrST_g5624 [Triparma strigata]